MTGDVELSEDMFLITRETAEAYLKTKSEAQKTAPSPDTSVQPQQPGLGRETTPSTPQPSPSGGGESPSPKPEQLTFEWMGWSGEVPPQKWMNFYTKVLSKFASTKGLKLKLSVAVSDQKRQNRSPGWSKIHSTNGDKGAINIDWDAASRMLSCRVVTRKGGQPNAIIGNFIAYLLASKFHRKIQAVQVIPR